MVLDLLYVGIFCCQIVVGWKKGIIFGVDNSSSAYADSWQKIINPKF